MLKGGAGIAIAPKPFIPPLNKPIIQQLGLRPRTVGGTYGTFGYAGALLQVPGGSMTSIESVSDEPDAWFKLDRTDHKLALGGAWTIAESARLDRELTALQWSGRGNIDIDASKSLPAG